MKIRVQRVGVLQSGKIGAVVYGFIAVIMLPFILLGALAGGKEALGMVIMLLIYPLLGFIGGVIFAALYNLAVNMVGGMVLELQEEEIQPNVPNY